MILPSGASATAYAVSLPPAKSIVTLPPFPNAASGAPAGVNRLTAMSWTPAPAVLPTVISEPSLCRAEAKARSSAAKLTVVLPPVPYAGSRVPGVAAPVLATVIKVIITAAATITSTVRARAPRFRLSLPIRIRPAPVAVRVPVS